MSDPYIEVMSRVEANANGKADIMGSYDCDKGVLAMPEKLIRLLGSRDSNDLIIEYCDLISMYDEWLEEAIKKQDPAVCAALEEIYTKAQGAGVILTSFRSSRVGTTTAHIIQRTIMQLAGG